MSSLPLNKDEELNIKQYMIDFVRRVSSTSEEKRPEEIAILPAMIKILLWKD